MPPQLPRQPETTTALAKSSARAFDLLADARNHVYSVDFYVIDLTLVTDSLLGEPLRAKLAHGNATNILISGEQLERVAETHPETLDELRHGIEAGTASIVGGRYSFDSVDHLGPEALLADLQRGQSIAKQRVGREYAVYGQFNSNYAVLLPEILRNLGFHGATPCFVRWRPIAACRSAEDEVGCHT